MIRLLIVDDDITFINALQRHVPWDKLGIEVIGTAGDGIEALNLCEKQKPDIILMDVRMPRMDGIELAVRLRESIPDCQIIFMSIYSDKAYLKMAIKVRAIDYIEKPVDPIELQNALVNAVNLIKQDRNLEASGRKRYSRTVEDIIQFIMEHYSEEITIEFLANQVYLTPNYLCNIFKKETGKTINQFITEIRIDKSKEMLANTYNSLTEIASAVGYNDVRHFSKLFSKIVGKTPSEFRRWQ